MNLRREQLLAGAGLAEQQHRRGGGRDLLHERHDLAHRGALADDDAGAETLARFGAQIEIFGAQLLAPPFGVLERLVLRLFALQPSQHAAERLREDVQAMQRVGGPGAIFADQREDHRAGDAIRDHQRHRRGGSDAQPRG